MKDARTKDKNNSGASNLQKVERKRKKPDAIIMGTFSRVLYFNEQVKNNNANTPKRIEGTSARALNARYKVIGRNNKIRVT